MKRYEITADYDVVGYGITEKEDPYGEWVKYEDVLLLIETNEAMYNLIMSERLIKE